MYICIYIYNISYHFILPIIQLLIMVIDNFLYQMMLKQNGKKFQYLLISIQITNVKIRLKSIKYRHHGNVRIMVMLLFFLKLIQK